MARLVGTVLIVVGAVLVVLGIMATRKTGEKVVEEVTGHYTNKTVWYIVGGVALVAGGFGLRRLK
jgi:NADH:ubiquinone oxidoreductase subunit D